MSAVRRTWLRTHSAAPAIVGLLAVAVLTWAVAQGVVQDRLTNPLGETYASLSVTLILPVLAATLLPVVWHDRIDPSIALPARPLRSARAAWWLLGVSAAYGALAPVQGLVGASQLRIDIGLLAGLSTLALCGLGLGPALAVPLIVLLPHLARRTGAPQRWWTVLATGHPSVTSGVAGGLAMLGLVTYALVGPRHGTDLAGGGID